MTNLDLGKKQITNHHNKVHDIVNAWFKCNI